MAIRFDTGGEEYHLSTGLPANLVPSTVAMWVRLAVDTNTYQIFFNDDDTNYLLGCAGDGTTLIFYNGSDRTTGQTLTVGTWYHVALVSSGTNRTIYLNGASVLSYTDPGSSDVPSSLYIGSSSGGSFTLNGRLAAFKMWTAALTQAEVQQEMNQYAPFRTANLYAFWPMLAVGDGGTDYSGNGHNLSASGTLSTEDGPPIQWRRGPLRWAIAGGGTTFTKDLAGSITPAGTIVKQANKTLSGSITPAGTIVKLIGKILSGSITPSGALALLRTQVISLQGSITPAGTLSKLVSKLLGGSITPSGTIAKTESKGLSGSVTPSGSIAKAVGKFLSGSITPSGALSITKSILLSLSGSITPSGTLTRSIQKTLAGAITPAGALFKTIGKFFSGLITPAGNFIASILGGGGDPCIVTITDQARIAVTCSDAAKITLAFSDQAKIIVTLSDSPGS